MPTPMDPHRVCLVDIRGVAVGPDGDVFVLDRGSYHVVAFDSTGAARVVAGRSGEGPGEFSLPMHLAPSAHGFSVVDYNLKRITEFDWSGRFVKLTLTPSLPQPWRHVVRNDTAWVASNMGTDAERLFDIVNLGTGEVITGRGFELEDKPFGSGLGIAFTPKGDLLVNTARPGVWMMNSGGSWSRRGAPRFPDDTPPREEQVAPNLSRVTPSQHKASGLAAIGDSLVLQGAYSYPRPFDWNNQPARGEEIVTLNVYRKDGIHLTTLPLPPRTSVNALAADPVTGRIFLPMADPFPQVVEYKLTECQHR